MNRLLNPSWAVALSKFLTLNFNPYPYTGTRIIYDRKFLLECKNSLIARTPPCCLPQIPGVTTLPTVPPSKLELLKEQKQTEEEITDDEQFEMDM